MDPRSRLTDDHASLDKLLREIAAALRDRNVQAVASNLDLFWARLAVHIRSEHLHLFPAVLRGLKSGGAINLTGLSLAETESVVAVLRTDHDFFMRELANAMALVRNQTGELPADSLTGVRRIVRAVDMRLENHNKLEETRIYSLTTKVLSTQQQAELDAQIRRELVKRPKRFTAEQWPSQPDRDIAAIVANEH